MELSFKEDHISQIPALILLEKLGFKYVSPEEAIEVRGGKTSNVLLEPILRKQLRNINSTVQVSGNRTTIFSDQNIENGITAMRNVAMNNGYIAANQEIYDMLTYGKTLKQNVDGDEKSYNLQYIDWKHIDRNVFHVTEEYTVSRTGTHDTYRPDIILFVNGIPLVIIECKRPDIEDSIEQAISQHLRNQKEDGIRNLYKYSAILMSIATSSASYATTGTPEKFWSIWREQFNSKEEETRKKIILKDIVNKPLEKDEFDKLFSSRFHYVKDYFAERGQATTEVTEQDIYLYSLCRPSRLLDMIFNFTVFDNGTKKIARYQQYFAVKSIMQRILPINGGKRRGGVIWHTQGSGKSLTMIMLAQAIVMEKKIPNPRIILVTDRTDLDAQITGTFKKCGVPVLNASTGKNLVALLEGNNDAVITTVINKFQTAINRIHNPLESPDIFVLIDEAHRTQYGEMSIKMQLTLPNACCIAMTGTPLMKKEKNTFDKFGGIIKPVYTVAQAVKDKEIVPLLYEGRIVPQSVNSEAIDKYFNLICEPLTDYQRADLKNKYSRAQQINENEQRMYAIAWDISCHFRDNWKGTPFKGELVCPLKKIAIRYKELFDAIGIVSTEVLITSPDDREGETEYSGSTNDRVKIFWKKMMDEHGNQKRYETNITNRFKNEDAPEIIIVVDKLITGFDEPKNTIMYLDRNLKDHTLLQAVARVNRKYDDKDYGYIIDYYGVLDELNKALYVYSDYDEDEEADIKNTMINIKKEFEKLPQLYSDLWDIFKEIRNKKDLETYCSLLRYDDIRHNFYEKLTAFSGCLKIALSSIEFYHCTPKEEIERYKSDFAMFIKLRRAVQQRFSDAINYKKYENQIEKLINTHVQSRDVQQLTKLVNIFDKNEFEAEVENIIGKAAKADTIASRTKKYINEKIDTDPAFYKKFSELIEATIREYEQNRISETEYLEKITKCKNDVLSHTNHDIPEDLVNNDAGKAFFGLTMEGLHAIKPDSHVNLKEIAKNTAIAFDNIFKSNAIVDWQNNNTLIGQINIKLGDYLIDEIKEKRAIILPNDIIDSIVNQCIDVAKLWYYAK